MEKIIELLEEAGKDLQTGPGGMFYADQMRAARRVIEKAIYILKHPAWETPEQYEKRTGEKWPDNGAVYYQYILNGAARDKWRTGNYKNISDSDADFRSHNAGHHQIVCATEAGPPPDNWEPGETR